MFSRQPDTVASPAVALVYRGGVPAEEAWSRIPAGLARGFREIGCEPSFVDAEPREPFIRLAKGWSAVVRRNRRGGMVAPEIRTLRKVTARVRALGSPDYAAVVQMGSDFGIPFGGELVTYEDATVAQRTRVDHLDKILGANAIDSWLAAQTHCYQTATGCCTMSQAAADSIVNDYGISPEKVHVVWAGRNCDPRPVDRDWSKPHFLFVGHDWERKNGPLVLKAFARLRERFPAAQLELAGGHPNVDQVGVTAHGPLDLADAAGKRKAEQLFESATCFVMPSRFEPFGMVYAEAAAAGVPSIGSTGGGALDAIGEGGLLVEPGDESALLNAMVAMCDPGRAAALGRRALARADMFTWTAVAQRLAGVLGFLSPRLRAGS